MHFFSYNPMTWSATPQTMACPGGILISRGIKPFHRADNPSSTYMHLIACIIPLYFTVFDLLWAISLVFTTSKGPVQIGPAVPARNPETMDCHGSRTFPSPSCFFHRTTSNEFFAVNIAAWFVPLRITVGDAPAQRPRNPSSRITVLAQWIGPRYFNRFDWIPFCCCNLILTTCQNPDGYFELTQTLINSMYVCIAVYRIFFPPKTKRRKGTTTSPQTAWR